MAVYKELDQIMLAPHITSYAGYSGFIRVQDGVFVDDTCREVTISGYNAWKVVLHHPTYAGFMGQDPDSQPVGF